MSNDVDHDDTAAGTTPSEHEPGDGGAGDEKPSEGKAKHSLGERIREHLMAAEVAAEESAGYGFVTESIEAAEAAVDPDHELGSAGQDDESDEEASKH